MGAFLRSILAVFVGLIVAMIILLLVEFSSSQIFPVPPDIVLTGGTGQIPVGALILVLLGWAIGSFVGPWLAGRMAGRAPLVHGMIVAVLLLIAGITNLLAFPHPIWMWVLGIASFVGLGYAGARTADRPKPAS